MKHDAVLALGSSKEWLTGGHHPEPGWGQSDPEAFGEERVALDCGKKKLVPVILQSDSSNMSKRSIARCGCQVGLLKNHWYIRSTLQAFLH